MTERTFPSSSSNVIPLRTSVAPKLLVKFFTSSIAIIKSSLNLEVVKLLFKLAEKNCEYAAEYEIVNGGEEQRPDLT